MSWPEIATLCAVFLVCVSARTPGTTVARLDGRNARLKATIHRSVTYSQEYNRTVATLGERVAHIEGRLEAYEKIIDDNAGSEGDSG